MFEYVFKDVQALALGWALDMIVAIALSSYDFEQLDGISSILRPLHPSWDRTALPLLHSSWDQTAFHATTVDVSCT